MPAKRVSPESNEERGHNNEKKMDRPQTRWIIIFMMVYFFLTDGFSTTCFGQVNNILSRFYDVDIQKIDWLTSVPSASSAISLFIMTWIVASGLIKLRKWCLISAIFRILAWIFIVLGGINRSFFVLTIVGQIAVGIANAVNFSLMPLAATTWFPDHEKAIVVALAFSALNTGRMLGFIIPSHMLPKTNSTSTSLSTYYVNGVKTDWLTQVSIALTAIFSSFLAASMIFGFFTFFFVFDSPSPMQTLPSNTKRHLCAVQQQAANKRAEYTLLAKMDHAKDTVKSKTISWFRVSKRQLTQRSFMTISVPYILIACLSSPWFALMSDMLRATPFTNVFFEDGPSNKSSNDVIYTSNEMAGKVMSLFCAGCFLAGTITQKLSKLLHFRHEYISSVAVWGVVASSVGNYVSFTQGVIETVFICIFLFGLFVTTASIALAALLTDHIDSKDHIAVRLWLAVFSSGVASTLPHLGRYLFQNFGSTSLHIFYIVTTTIVAIFVMFLKCLHVAKTMDTVNGNDKLRI